MNNENQNPNEKPSTLPSGVRIGIAMGTLIAVLVAFNQCTMEKKTVNKKSTRTTASTNVPASENKDAGDIISDNELPDELVMPPMNAPTPDSELDQIDVGVKNFEQVFLSMAAVTGVAPSTNSVNNLYKEISIQLPADNSVKSFLPANQVAITKLAAEFCEVLVESGTLRTAVWPTINFGQNPVQAFTPANKQLIINQAISRFMPPLDSQTQVLTYNEMARLFDELLSGEDAGSNVTTRKVVKGMCISSLASAHATLL